MLSLSSSAAVNLSHAPERPQITLRGERVPSRSDSGKKQGQWPILESLKQG